MLSLSTVTFFTALVEPIVFRRRLAIARAGDRRVVVVGVALLLEVELRADALGLALGLGSALLAGDVRRAQWQARAPSRRAARPSG